MITSIANRNEVETKLVVDGKPLTITLLQSITVDDVIGTEAQVQATAINKANQQMLVGRRVDRNIRDYLIRLGVER